MKTIFKISIFLYLLQYAFISNAQNIFPATGSAGIGTTTPASSALLELKSTTQGMLAPRMTITQRNAIISPVTGLFIYQTNSTPGFYYYSGSAWVQVANASTGVNKSLSNLNTTTSINANLLPNANDSIDLG